MCTAPLLPPHNFVWMPHSVFMLPSSFEKPCSVFPATCYFQPHPAQDRPSARPWYRRHEHVRVSPESGPTSRLHTQTCTMQQHDRCEEHVHAAKPSRPHLSPSSWACSAPLALRHRDGGLHIPDAGVALVVQGVPLQAVAMQVLHAVLELPPGQRVRLHRGATLKHLPGARQHPTPQTPARCMATSNLPGPYRALGTCASCQQRSDQSLWLHEGQDVVPEACMHGTALWPEGWAF